MALLVLDRLTKRFGGMTAVADVSLQVVRGEFVTLLGPSGCGKTTTLRMIAGFETPSSGRVLLEGRDVTGHSPQRRGVGLVFQNYALFPHLDVFENIAFGLRTRRLARGEIRLQVERALERVDLAGYARRKVQELSGGEQQRVALARALAPEPPVLLLDEPLSNLDAALRERTRVELRALLKRLAITAVFVTHDQEEAFALSDRIAVLDRGAVQQVGTPESLYHAPANVFVASFLGRANFLDGEVVEVLEDGLVCRVHAGALWRARGPDPDGDPAPRPGDRVRVMVRPEALELLPAHVPAAAGSGGAATDGAAGGPRASLPGEVVDRRFAGASTLYRVVAGEVELTVLAADDAARPGETVHLRARPGATVHAFAGTSRTPEPAAAEPAALP